ncbi:ABC transporter ATP-binding protein [Streptomyces sp. DSM 44917]|uniref:ABC transporter ATP-binding protein n=1 Tax=Streptomyces boetiae TaxID=3075541 RepID=A0ABU2LF53_9ACTN|nr:ABC transporter ATP-binding protein [Streptomyces sp. DSM 44917]MDT0310137.1 ABC transporter ATP-binding protein [Streptomyces sp. DSM 44917]
MFTPESLRILWSFARPHRRALAGGLLLALAASAMSLATPMVTKEVLDALDEGASLGGPVLALAGLLVAGSVLYWAEWVLLGSVGERVVLQARESVVRRFFRATVPAISARPPGELVTRAVSDTVLLREAASSSVTGLINGAVMLVGTLVLMAVLDLVLLGTTVAAVVVVVVLFAVLMPGIAKAQERAQEHVGRLGGTLEGSLRAIRTVKAGGAEERESERIARDARASARHGVRAVRLEATAWTIAWSGIQLAVILILAIGAWRVSEGHLEVSSLIAFLLYAFGLMEPVTELSQNLTALQSGLAAAERIKEVQRLPVESDGPGAGSPAGRAEGPVVELRGVTASYAPGREPAVRGLDLALPRRGHVAIVGPSGAGKTTVFSLLLRFLEPQGGELLLDGVPYERHGHAGVRARLAYVEQDTPLLPGTLRENLLHSRPDAGEEEVRRVLADVRLEGKVAALPGGLDTELSAAAVSGGERQRIALARALLRRPDVLLLDEATAQLDALTEAAVHDCVRRRSREGTVVTIAHRLSTVTDADEIVVMEAGRIRARGAHGDLLTRDALYGELVRALRMADTAPTP